MSDTTALAVALVRASERLGYPLARGPGQINATYIEGCNLDGTKNRNRPTHFDDACFLTTFRKGIPALVGKYKCTTQPGPHYTDEDNWLNSEGAANAALGYHRDVWMVGTHSGDHEALVQRGGMIVVVRDKDADHKRDPDEPRRKGFYGINCHGPRRREDVVALVGRYSAGCWVIDSMPGHRAMMKVRMSDPRYIADKRFRFSAALLSYEMFAGKA